MAGFFMGFAWRTQRAHSTRGGIEPSTHTQTHNGLLGVSLTRAYHGRDSDWPVAAPRGRGVA